MILIYSPQSSPRLQYICKFVFEEQMGLTFSLTIDKENFANYEGAKINYSKQIFNDHSFTITPYGLLTEKNIVSQQPVCFTVHQTKAFFKTDNGNISFDILAASFYLMSRYEEYLPHTKDDYGRYAHQQSLAFKENFLQLPLVNIWLQHFRKSLQHHFKDLALKTPAFSFTPTYDVDMAWSYKNKGLLRNIGGILKTGSISRLPVLLRLQKDPFDCFDFLKDLHQTHQLQPIYFFLLATRTSAYDKNISPYDYGMWQLMKKLNKEATLGIHPSWRSHSLPNLIKKEKKILETATNSIIEKSRQHYIYFNLPDTFEHLLLNGITADYSMGYGSINGFRASVASPFYWYNLATEKCTILRLHPFCFMDANSHYEQNFTVAQAAKELSDYAAICQAVGGEMITIFHNNFLGSHPAFNGWQKCYKNFITQLR